MRTSNRVVCNRIKDLRFELHLYKNQFVFGLIINNVGIKAQNDMLSLGPLSGTAELSEEKQVVIRISY